MLRWIRCWLDWHGRGDWDYSHAQDMSSGGFTTLRRCRHCGRVDLLRGFSTWERTR